jgi:hypothetical protein
MSLRPRLPAPKVQNFPLSIIIQQLMTFGTTIDLQLVMLNEKENKKKELGI